MSGLIIYFCNDLCGSHLSVSHQTWARVAVVAKTVEKRLTECVKQGSSLSSLSHVNNCGVCLCYVTCFET